MIGKIDSFATIAGGRQNFMEPNNAPYAAIPGGDSLTANSFAQTVVGYNNRVTGTVIHGTPHALIDTPLFIVGNGDNASSPSNAFEVSYDGHSSAFQNIGTGGATGAGPTQSRIGTTYASNTIVAWGDIAPAANHTNTSIDDIGIASVVWGGIGTGAYTITLNVVNQDGTAHTFTTGDAAITVSIGPGPAAAAGMITVTTLVAGPPTTFVVKTFNAGGALSDGYGFQFHVVAR